MSPPFKAITHYGNRIYKMQLGLKMNNIRSVFRVFFSGGANLLTYLTSTDMIVSRIYDPLPEWGQILLLALWIILAVLLFLWFLLSIAKLFLRKKCEKYGTRKIPCKMENLYYYKVANRSEWILLRMHKYTYHETYNIRRQIFLSKYTDKKDVFDGVKNLVKEFQQSLNMIFNLDMTIGVKLVAKMGKQNVLQTYLLVPSQSEIERDNRKVLDAYSIKKLSSEDVVDYVKDIRNKSSKLPQNSAFNYVLSSSKNYWMSNDLAIDEKKGLFASTSCNYGKYYNSMAVFAICPPRPDGENNVPIRGVLTFDTMEKGTLSEKECKFIMGYFAHCLYEILKDLK